MKKTGFKCVESKNGLPIVEVLMEGQSILLHSKYDPIKEAERLIDSLKDKIENADHILLYGAGMGYIVRYFFEKYPNKLVSVYEPFEEVANLCIQQKGQTKFPLEYLENYVVENSKKNMEESLMVFDEATQHKIEIIVLPSYERLNLAHLKVFIQTFKKQVDIKKANEVTTSTFSRRWTINALINLPKTFEHFNILGEKKKYFEGKPVLLVSAGPSLSEEIENIRIVKENGLAYIFAVGSANKTLIQEGILPDAVCTYDPQSHNHLVFKYLYERDIKTVPMIYGTTVGFETLDFYKGPKLYFTTTKDQLTANFHLDKQVVIEDATSIAIVTLQLLNELKVSKIILVGQNFAFKRNKFYAKGIDRFDNKKNEVTDNSVQEDDLIRTYEVVDVHGNQVLTNIILKRMKENMETYLKRITIPVINTTNGGAVINRTTFQPLKQVIKEELTEKIVVEDWWKSELQEESSMILNQDIIRKYSKSFEHFLEQDKNLLNHLISFQHALKCLNVNQVQRKLKQLDELFNKYHNNLFYHTTILPIAQLAFENLNAGTQLIPTMDSSIEKTEKLIQLYITYLASCRAIYKDIAPIVSNLTIPKLNEIHNTKSYIATSSIFRYAGEWQKKMPPPKERVPNYLTKERQKEWNKQMKLKDKIEVLIPFNTTTKIGSKIHFRFEGTKLSLFGKNATNEVLKLKVIIDNKSTLITINEKVAEETYNLYIRKEIYECTSLKNEFHEVTIEVLSKNSNFHFQGIEIDKEGRAYHIDEVTQMNQLKIGKRIRCHIGSEIVDGKALITNIGEENDVKMALNSTQPYGDFYLIKVCEEEGISKFISDRSIGLKEIVNLTSHENSNIEINRVPILNYNSPFSELVSCSSSYNNGNNTWSAYKAFNKKVESYKDAWATDRGITTGWIKYKFNNPVILNCYTLINQKSHGNYDTTLRMPSNWEFQAWTETEWVTLDTRDDIINWIDKVKKYFVFENKNAYKEYRISISLNNGDKEFLAIGEIELI